MTNDYLIHYGVLGMKWGIRRSREVEDAKHKFRTDMYKLWDKTKDDEDIGKRSNFEAEYNKLRSDYKKNLASAKSRAAVRLGEKHGMSAKASKRINDLSNAKALAQSWLLGSYGARRYNESRASGRTRGEAGLIGYGTGMLSKGTLGIYGRARDKVITKRKRNA